MSPHDRHHAPDTLDPLAETPPAVQPRNVVRPETRGSWRWTPEGVAAVVGVAVTVGGALMGLSLHAYGLARDVEQLKSEASDHSKEVAARRVINEARFQAIETRLSRTEDTAASDRKYIELEFSGITKSLDALKTDIAEIKKQTK